MTQNPEEYRYCQILQDPPKPGAGAIVSAPVTIFDVFDVSYPLSLILPGVCLLRLACIAAPHIAGSLVRGIIA